MAILQPLIPRAAQALLGNIGAPTNELGDPLGRTNELGDALTSPIDAPPSPPPLSPLIAQANGLMADENKRRNPVAPTTTLGKIGHVAAGIGNVLGDIFAPDTMALIPGTQLHNERIIQRDEADLQKNSQLQTEESGRAQQAATTAYTEQRPDIERGKIRQHLVTALAPKGFNITDNPDSPGGFDIAEDPNSQGYKDRVSLSAMHDATAEKEAIQSDIAKNHFVAGTPEYAEAQRKLAQVDQRLNIAMQGLGLRRETLSFNEDKNYNPEPTAAERGKGDLAKSAVERVAEMKSIVAKHPEYFGPVAGRAQNAQAWLGSSDPDAVTYNTAAQYLADHSAGVFGGRGQYITQALHDITSPRYTPEGLNAALDEADKAARGFVTAGTPHAKGKNGAAITPPAPKVKTYNPTTGRIE